MLIFLWLIPYTSSSKWKRQMDQPDEVRRGLEMETSLKARGFAWLPAKKSDWTRVQMTKNPTRSGQRYEQ